MDKTWNSKPPSKCDVCGKTIDNEFYDVKTYGGPWGILCHEDWRLIGHFGQHYRLHDDGVFHKVGNVRKAS